MNLGMDLKRRDIQTRDSFYIAYCILSSFLKPYCFFIKEESACANANARHVCLCADFEEQLYDNRVTGQTFRHPSSQSSEDTSTTLSRSPSSLNNKKPEFVFLVIMFLQVEIWCCGVLMT